MTLYCHKYGIKRKRGNGIDKGSPQRVEIEKLCLDKLTKLDKSSLINQYSKIN